MAAPTNSAPSDGSVEGEQASLPWDPFLRHERFGLACGPKEPTPWLKGFLAELREPIDVSADKRLNLEHIGQDMPTAYKEVRLKKRQEMNDDLDDRMKHDLERQFVLRNLNRVVKDVYKGDPLEFEYRRVELAQLDFQYRQYLEDMHHRPELIDELGSQLMGAELRWRKKMRDDMPWEEHFSREIREDFDGPMWKHDPKAHPVASKRADDMLENS